MTILPRAPLLKEDLPPRAIAGRPASNPATVLQKLRDLTGEEECVNLLIGVGTRRAIANVPVFLANAPKAASRDIGRGTDLRQPEVSIAIKYLAGQGWINTGEAPSQHKGRPQKIYSLAIPIKQIITAIEKAKKDEAANRLALVKKMRDYF